jgi:hypothetical protein
MSMFTTRSSVVFVLALLALLVGRDTRSVVHAQPGNAPAALVGVTGTASGDGEFAGTLLLTRFDTQNSTGGITAIGSITGVLNGRTVLTPVALPLSVRSSVPGDTEPAAAVPDACDAVQIDLAPATFRALGSVVTLDPVSFDIAASQAATPSPGLSFPPAVTTESTNVTSPPASPLVTGTATPSTPAGSRTPGVISPVPQPTTTARPISTQQFSQLLCSVSRLSASGGSSGQLVPLLNQVLVALRQ